MADMEARTSGSFLSELRTEATLPSFMAGIVSGFTQVILATSLAGFVFRGELAAWLPRGIGIALLCTALASITGALLSSAPGIIGRIQSAPNVIFAGIAAALVAGGATEATIFAMLVAVTVLTGVLMAVMASFQLGGLVRYLPYPVVGGFLAGTGWLLIEGALGIMSTQPLTLSTLPVFFQPEQLLLWLPGVGVAVVLFVGSKLIKHPLAMPGLLALSLGLMYVSLLIAGVALPEATDRGLLLGAIGDVRWQPFNPGLLPQVDWLAIAGQTGGIATVFGLAVVNLLLNASGLEFLANQDVDLNHELRTAGLTTTLAGLAGGFVGYQSLSLSTISYNVGGRGRLPGLVSGLVCVAVLIIGSALLAYIPIAVLGGLLLFVGANLLDEWLIQSAKRFSRVEYGVLAVILAIIIATDFLVGVAVGLIAAVVIFVVNYSQISVVRHALTGHDIRSNVERVSSARRALDRAGSSTYVLQLQGFIFFGTAHDLYERIKQHVTVTNEGKTRFMVLDFKRVTGLDSSARLSFMKVRRLAQRHDITIVLTSLGDLHPEELGLNAESDDRVQVFPDLDHGLEWCEEEILLNERVSAAFLPVSFAAQFKAMGIPKEQIKPLMGYFTMCSFEEGDVLIRQGDPADSLYHIELGEVGIYFTGEDGSQLRLRTIGMGSLVGEVGFYQSKTRTASVIATMPTVAHQLTHEDLERMQAEHPELAAAFHRLTARTLAERLQSNNKLVQQLME